MNAPCEFSPRERYERLRAMRLDLDMTRGKPCPEQLSLSWPLLQYTGTHAFPSGNDAWNYGFLEGLPEARQLFGDYLGIPAKNTYVLGNSSLAIIHDIVVQMLLRGFDQRAPWDLPADAGKPTMLCPVPGYDRHFAICESYGINMISLPMDSTGPDLRIVEQFAQRPNVVGIMCVPKYSNPSGITYSRSVCERLANMRTANPSFRVFWDLAYHAHDLEERGDELSNFFTLCKLMGNEDRPFVIGSTSKITFAGGGVGMLGASERNLAWFRSSLALQTLGGDKLNQLRHVRFFRDVEGIRSHMRKHAAKLKPKFDAALEVFERELAGTRLAIWSRPRGGYFIALKTKSARAKKTVELAGKIGIRLTPAGAMHPYGNDPYDAWIRFAPTFPSIEEVRIGAEALCICLKLADQA